MPSLDIKSPWQALGLGSPPPSSLFRLEKRHVVLCHPGLTQLPADIAGRQRWIADFVRTSRSSKSSATRVLQDAGRRWFSGMFSGDTSVWFVQPGATGEAPRLMFYDANDPYGGRGEAPDLLKHDLNELSRMNSEQLGQALSFVPWPFWRMKVRGTATTSFFRDESRYFAVVSNPVLPNMLSERRAWRDQVVAALEANFDGAAVETFSDDRGNNGRAFRTGLIALPLNDEGSSAVGVYASGGNGGGQRGLLEQGLALLRSLDSDGLMAGVDNAVRWQSPENIMPSD